MFTFSFSITLLIIHSSNGISIWFLHWLSWTTHTLKCLFPEVSPALDTRWLVAGGCVVDCCGCHVLHVATPTKPPVPKQDEAHRRLDLHTITAWHASVTLHTNTAWHAWVTLHTSTAWHAPVTSTPERHRRSITNSIKLFEVSMSKELVFDLCLAPRCYTHVLSREHSHLFTCA